MHECQSWTEALDLGTLEHVALVGGGGKTTTLWSLARERAQHRPVVVSSTTKASASPEDVPLVTWRDSMAADEAAAVVRDALEGSALVALGNAARPDRIQSVPPHVLDAVFAGTAADVLNEADGARMKPFKAPASHEPVLGRSTTSAVIVVGSDAIGQVVDDQHVHRPEMIRAVTGLREGDPIDAVAVAGVARYYRMKIHEQAPHARCVLLLNKLDRASAAGVDAIAAAIRKGWDGLLAGAAQRDALKLWRWA